MSKTFRPWDVDQVWLLPPSVHDFVPPGHAAHLIREIVREKLDVGAILSTYEEPRGYPPFDPGMMTALLLYAYSQGIDASRRIARACQQRLDVMAVTGRARPNEVSADPGLCSKTNLLALTERRIRPYLATGRAKDPAGGEAKRRGPLVATMRDKLRRAGRRSRYRLRKQVVEPVFGQIKQARGFRRRLAPSADLGGRRGAAPFCAASTRSATNGR